MPCKTRKAFDCGYADLGYNERQRAGASAACSKRAANGDHDRFRRNRQAQSANRDILCLRMEINYMKKRIISFSDKFYNDIQSGG